MSNRYLIGKVNSNGNTVVITVEKIIDAIVGNYYKIIVVKNNQYIEDYDSENWLETAEKWRDFQRQYFGDIIKFHIDL